MQFEEVKSFHEANEKLIALPELIVKKTGEMGAAREQYLLAKEHYEQVYSKSLLETKLREPDKTQGELVANAKILAFDSKIAEIRAESTYRRLSGEIIALRDQLQILQEISYNLRRESQIS